MSEESIRILLLESSALSMLEIIEKLDQPEDEVLKRLQFMVENGSLRLTLQNKFELVNK
ncbi:MAG: hypothetical protein U5K51_09375 [Flavobacteriaceae bacterium]|nr:hypothetical protein [Flavobacteriaceae bacterium]